MIRIAILWRELPPYTVSCIRELAMHQDVELLVVRYSHENEKPFDQKSRCLPIPVYTIYEKDDKRKQFHVLSGYLENFRPNLLLVSGWSNSIFNKAVRLVKSFNCKVICVSDNVWRGNIKHTIGTIFARILFQKRYSAMFVPGERSVPLARALGYSGKNLIKGCYSCDWSLYASAHLKREIQTRDKWPHVMVFVGSLIERKGISKIVKAYHNYRINARFPWELWVIGDGPLRKQIEDEDGVTVYGFLQPEECAHLMTQSGAFVLASHCEPWGVVIHEATAAGLPIICTDICGAAADLVSEGFNGFLIENNDIECIYKAIVKMTSMTDDDLRVMSNNSYIISKRNTPKLWAQKIINYSINNGL